MYMFLSYTVLPFLEIRHTDRKKPPLQNARRTPDPVFFLQRRFVGES